MVTAAAETARTVVGIVGNVISFFLFASPVPTFYKIWKQKSVEEFKPDPYVATVMNCVLWIFYGMPVVHPHSTLVWTINGIGLVMELTYLIIFVLFADNKRRLKVGMYLIIEVVFLAVVIVITMLCFHTHEKRSMVVGILCVIFGVGMYCSPLTVMKKVITTKSVKYMPFYLSLANFLNGFVWLTYALIRFDPYITTANGLGALSGTVQLILYATYYRSTPKDGDEKPPPTEVQLSTNERSRPAV